MSSSLQCSEIPWFGRSFWTDFSKFPDSEVHFGPVFRNSLIRKFILVRSTDYAEKLKTCRFFGEPIFIGVPKIPVSVYRFYLVYRNDWKFEFLDLLTFFFWNNIHGLWSYYLLIFYAFDKIFESLYIEFNLMWLCLN